MVGHGILELALVALLLLGLGPYLSKDIVFGVVGVCGAGILMWMALGMFRSIPSLKLNLEPGKEASGNPIRAGVLMSLANPYFIIWWATIGVGYIVYAMKFGTVGVIAFFAGHISADFAWYSVVSLTISKGRRLISDGLYRRIIGFCATALIIFSGWFGYMGVQKLVAVVM
jgi:threonine/homoserine/homoserine lactone efflux protein